MSFLTWLIIVAGALGLLGAAALVVVTWRGGRYRADEVASAIAWMAAQPVRLRLGGEHVTSLAWAFHRLADEFERGLTLSRWLTVMWLAGEPEPARPAGEPDVPRQRLLYELEERRLVQRLSTGGMREELWSLSDGGRAAVRAIGSDLPLYATARAEPAEL